ncbi:response regulator [Paenibacillus sp. GCM10027626]|uniref:response regulator transcription factor n=1 Tax=Paenibacillus sp. GCM10027626 TaxID=3273411 RepID=UPI003641719A
MLKMLVVDDDRFERDGVKFLVDKYNLELEIAEADSGESALKYIDSHDVDILFTDIRMKGMDGLELAERIRERNAAIKVIFMSAYGEFEYAQRAIDLKAIRYILKPVQVSEFIKVVAQVIQLCGEERQAKEQQVRLEESYRKEQRYNKQKLLTDLIMGHKEPEEIGQPLPIASFNGYRYVRMLLLDSRTRLFDRLDLDFDRQIAEAVRRACDVVHLNEFQSLLLLEAFAEEPQQTLGVLGRDLIDWLRTRFNCEVTVVIGGLVDDARQLYREYNALEMMLENKFFFDDSTVLLAGDMPLAANDLTKAIDDLLQELTGRIQRHRFEIVEPGFDQLFNLLQNSDHFSVIYVKYVCTEVVKALFEAAAKKNANKFRDSLEKIYKTSRLSDLRQVMHTIFAEYGTAAEPAADGVSKAVEEAVRTIECEYAADLSLELLAERVYLTPNYLSHLFKKQKGISINKYITLYRMEKAKELLLTTNRKIADIGQDVGYHNLPYFSSLFKNYYGKTPSQFREEA